MRVLHTSDWHVGKKLGRYDRSDEYREVIDEVVGIADDEAVDLVLHSGDLFDRPLPPIDALNIALDGLVGLSHGGDRPVVVIAGNHDSPGFFDALAPFLRRVNVHLVGGIKRPDDGGVLDLETAAGRAVVSAFPFLREGRSFEVWEPPEEHYKKYADRLRSISEAYSDPGGRDKRAVAGLLAFTVLRHASIHLLTRIDALSFPEPGRAVASVYAAMAGGPIPGAGALTGMRANLYRFDFVFAEEKPTQWMLVRADWRPAHADDFL